MRKYLVPLLLLSMLVVNVARSYIDDNVSSVSKTTIGGETLRWGLQKRGDGLAPGFDPGAPELLKKYAALFLGDINVKKVYLTFDEGYENGYTPQILDVLRDTNVPATFFITGQYLKENADLIKRMLDEGHDVGNHGMMHKSLPTISDGEIRKEISDLEEGFFNLTGKHTKYLRPPKGEYSERTLRITSEMGYTNVFWSFAYQDWLVNKPKGEEYAYNQIMKNLHSGEIILLHAVSVDNANVLKRAINDILQRGYAFGKLEELH